MNVEKFIYYLKKDFPEYEFNFQRHAEDWCRYFISHKGMQIGRITFSKVKSKEWDLYNIKYYKPYDLDYAPADDLFILFSFWIETGLRVDIAHLIPKAKAQHKEYIQKKLKWRKENPRYDRKGNSRSRPKLQATWMGQFKKLLCDYLESCKELKEKGE